MTVRDLNIINWYDTLVEDTVKAVGWFTTTVWTQLEVTGVSGGKGNGWGVDFMISLSLRTENGDLGGLWSCAPRL